MFFSEFLQRFTAQSIQNQFNGTLNKLDVFDTLSASFSLHSARKSSTGQLKITKASRNRLITMKIGSLRQRCPISH